MVFVLFFPSGIWGTLVKRLEAAGLVERRRGLEDERKVEVRMTAAGAALYCVLQSRDSLFLPMFFGFLAYENYQALQAGSRWR